MPKCGHEPGTSWPGALAGQERAGMKGQIHFPGWACQRLERLWGHVVPREGWELTSVPERDALGICSVGGKECESPHSSQRVVREVNVGGTVWISEFGRGFFSFLPRRYQNCLDPNNSIQKRYIPWLLEAPPYGCEGTHMASSTTQPCTGPRRSPHLPCHSWLVMEGAHA